MIAGTAGYLLLADLSHLKRPFLALLSDLIDRELIVEGAFELDLGRQLRISAIGVRLANAEWSARGGMLEAAARGQCLHPGSGFSYPTADTEACPFFH